MTGTAASSAEEFHKVYKLDVIIIPTNKKAIRIDMEDQVYKTGDGKYRAVIKEIRSRHEKGQPVLVGTIAIEKSEILSAMLKREGLQHEVLNAKNHEREALIIMSAGQKGAITIATNMAGRGTDIKLGPGVEELGGLHIIGTERHEARRIDDQLRGRAGRQGDPGSSQFFVSLEDELMRILGSERIKSLMTTLGVDEDQPIENPIISRSIGMAQEKIEGHNFDLRKHILDYDDVMNKHREIIYNLRRKFLNDDDKASIRKEILRILDSEIEKIVQYHTSGSPSEWNSDEVFEAINLIFPLEYEAKEKIKEITKSYSDDEKMRQEIKNYFSDLLIKYYDKREKEGGSDIMRQIERMVALRTIDIIWVDHLVLMEHLRDSVGLRGYGQKDPLVEYKKEGHIMFQKLLAAINSEIASAIFKVAIVPRAPQFAPIILGPDSDQAGPFVAPPSNNPVLTGAAGKPMDKKPVITGEVGRNDVCPCGSGKKYKKCCGKNK